MMTSFFRMIMHFAIEQSVKAFFKERHMNSMTWPKTVRISIRLKIYGGSEKKKVPWHGSVLQSWFVNRYSRKLEPAWWKKFLLISEVHVPKNSGRHKSPRRSNKVLIVIFFVDDSIGFPWTLSDSIVSQSQNVQLLNKTCFCLNLWVVYLLQSK